MLFCCLGTYVIMTLKVLRYLYERGDYDSSKLYNIEWENVFAGLDINTMWNVFHSKFMQFVNKYVPTKSFTSDKSSYPSWLNKEVLCAIKSKHKIIIG